MDRGVAFVTGASRGIGRASALALADAGFDLVLTARTLREGERFEHSATVRRSDTSPVPGSLEVTAREVAERGREAQVARMDLLDLASVDAAAAAARERWGRIDVLVNNAVYTGPGNLDVFLELPEELLERMLRANFLAPARLTRLLLPDMLERGSGVVVNVTSHAARSDPPAPAGRGGWGLGYGASKAALHRMAGTLAVELAGRGVRFHNLDPGFVLTEMMELQHREQGFEQMQGAPPRVPAAVVAWLASQPEAAAFDGETVVAQRFCEERGLLPDWP
jgi:NAD(P)-dependent dehydrogenase (short-subunit alcohol dehydrogenase family)